MAKIKQVVIQTDLQVGTDQQFAVFISGIASDGSVGSKCIIGAVGAIEIDLVVDGTSFTPVLVDVAEIQINAEVIVV